MTTLRSSLTSRQEEFENHFQLTSALEQRLVFDEPKTVGAVTLSVRHINTLKSGLIVHLYNIEEAIMTEAIRKLSSAICSFEPKRWTEHSLKEWLRGSIVVRIAENNEEGKLNTIFGASNQLLGINNLELQTLKKPPGTWDDKAIAKFASRLNVSFPLPAEMWVKIAPSARYGDQSPLQFLAEKRNAIAHGRRSFEDGADGLMLSDIRILADVVFEYLGHAADAFHSHIENESYLVPV